MLENVEQRNSLLGAIEKARNSSVIAYGLHDNAMIADDALPHLYDKLQALGRRERIDLLLSARAGVPEVCWRILNLLREYCDHLGVIVGTRVQGAASLLALGADEIVMGPLSELGSIDSIRRHPLLPRDEQGQPLPFSVGELNALVDFLGAGRTNSQDETENAKDGEGRGQLTTGLQGLDPSVVSTLMQYIHPIAIANIRQADALSRDLTDKALRRHMHVEDPQKVHRLVDLFNGGFQSPLYTVGRREASDLGLPVEEIDRDTWSSVLSLVQLYQAAIYTDRPDPTVPGAFFRYVCIIESVGRSTGLHQSYTQHEGQERVVQIRWETAVRGPGPGPSYGPGGISNN
ncbi:MAG TPA: hypothetical protein VM409_04840 [Chloroflexia bacterium]|nr:hypothetical protein [Chloroflexia bacterium]